MKLKYTNVSSKMKERENYLVELLKETIECVEAAIGLEIEYNEYIKVEKLKALKNKIKKETENSRS
jgi:hypothetical protein